MNWADWAILAILTVSCLISLKRGFVKEALSLAIWVAAFVIASLLSDNLSTLLANSIKTPSVRDVVAFGILFALTLVVGAMVNYLVGELVRMTGLSGTDRMFGMVFGLARGGVVVMAILLLVPGIVPIDQDSWWQQSAIIPHFLAFKEWSIEVANVLTNMVLSLWA